MKRQVGWSGLLERLRLEVPQWSRLLPQIPRLTAQALAAVESQERVLAELEQLRRATEQRNRFLLVGVSMVAAIAAMLAWAFLGLPFPRL